MTLGCDPAIIRGGKTTGPCHRRRAGVWTSYKSVPAGQAGRTIRCSRNYSPWDSCTMNRARMSNHASRITLSAGPGIPLMPRF